MSAVEPLRPIILYTCPQSNAASTGNRIVDVFSYLSVLPSIILGFAITQILQGFRALMLSRSRLRMYWPSVLWAVILLLIDVQAWWAMYALRGYNHWNFLDFAVLLAEMVPLYLLAALVFPNVEVEGAVDLRTHYFENHRWFFAMAVLFILLSVGKPLVLFGKWPAPMDLGLQIVFAVVAGIGAYTQRETFHKFLAPCVALLLCAYIALLFARIV
jgi:hypothetical protein